MIVMDMQKNIINANMDNSLRVNYNKLSLRSKRNLDLKSRKIHGSGEKIFNKDVYDDNFEILTLFNPKHTCNKLPRISKRTLQSDFSDKTYSDKSLYISDIKSVLCTICNKPFSNNSFLNQHMTSADSKGKCNQCIIGGKNLLRLSHLCEHLRTHIGIKCFNCNSCNKKFTRISN